MCNCALCGEFLTQPYFHNGKPYGYSCINKVLPAGKKAKKADRFQKAEGIVKDLYKNAVDVKISEPRMITKNHPEDNTVIQHQWIRITVVGLGFKKDHDFIIVRYNNRLNSNQEIDGEYFFKA